MSLIISISLPILYLSLCLITSILGVPLDERPDVRRQMRRQVDPLAVKGAPVVNGTVPQRLEIRQLRKNTAQWNLYLLAMNEYQQMDKSDRRSYYQLSGIHGRPFAEWDGVPLVQQIGYCFHTSSLFSTWHRPYMALFEQILYDVVQGIAASIDDDDNEECWCDPAQV